MYPIVKVATDMEAAKNALLEGYTPIECCYGRESVVDSLYLDHHGAYWDLEPVSLRAYRDHYAARASDARIVVTTSADLDATFAAAAVAGILPHPRHQWAARYPNYARDLTRMAEMVARRDDEPLYVLPVGRDCCGKMIANWEYRRKQSARYTTFWQGVWLWNDITTKLSPEDLRRGADGYLQDQAKRIKRALVANITGVGKHVGVVSSQCWGFDQWLQHYPVVVSLMPEKSRIVVGARNKADAQTLFGAMGLLEILDRLPGEWGGRASILTSPRNLSFSISDAMVIAGIIQDYIYNNSRANEYEHIDIPIIESCQAAYRSV